MKISMSFIFFLINFNLYSQVLPSDRLTDWTISGLNDTSTLNFTHYDFQFFGGVGDGVTANDLVLDTILSLVSNGAIIDFSSGDFLFNSPISLSDNIVLRGDGATSTTLKLDLGGTSHGIIIHGTQVNSDTSSFLYSATKDSNFIEIIDASNFNVGDWVRIIQDDISFVTSSWANGTVGQIVQITSILNNIVYFASPLRLSYNITLKPYIKKINPIKNVGVECLKILRLDDTDPEQASNIHYSRAVNCWINGIESEDCNYSHVKAEYSSNLHVSRSYFHHGFDYGSGGKAYGVMLHFTTNECMIENNIFEYLRHSMIVQAGANGNVFAYNYSFDPHRSSVPYNSSGEIVLHGNYPYLNLFEHNMCRNIIIDDSHGPNGYYNTFFRNRADLYGIIITTTNSPNQNIIGNEITYDAFPINLVNYDMSGNNHFLYGNNDKGTIDPAGTSNLPDSSYVYLTKPDYMPASSWVSIGSPNMPGQGEIPAYTRYMASDIFDGACEPIDFTAVENHLYAYKIYPNPSNNFINIESDNIIVELKVIDNLGRVVYYSKQKTDNQRIEVANWTRGYYLISIKDFNEDVYKTKFIKL